MISNRRITRRRLLAGGFGLAAAPLLGCVEAFDPGALLPSERSSEAAGDTVQLVARFAHISDTHVVDEESPARFPGAHEITHSAWRPYEAYSAQLVEGIVRAVNRTHAAGRSIDFLLHTGDACDNLQSNELEWLLAVLDGRPVDPRSGPDDRDPAAYPPIEMDPHAPFAPQGLYCNGVHGPAATIPWYLLRGNHDVHAIGVFPVIDAGDGHRLAPLPFDGRPGWVLPVRLDPLASSAYGRVTPAQPGPPRLFERPQPVPANAARAYFDEGGWIAALNSTATGPAGHGGTFAAEWGGQRFSVAPVPGLRLIGLDTNDRPMVLPGFFYSQGALSRRQLEYLERELALAAERDELVVVATHHPSGALDLTSGSEVGPELFRGVLQAWPNVVLHVAGHRHRHRVIDRAGYVEIETCATIDAPQEGRIIEIWREPGSGAVAVRYDTFSHLDDELPALGDDPLRELRRAAWELSRTGFKSPRKPVQAEELDGLPPEGLARDRRGIVWRE